MFCLEFSPFMIMQIYFLGLILPLALAKVESDGGNIALNFNSDVLMRAMGVPVCVRKCIDPFLDEVSVLWQMRAIVQNAKPLCRSHTQALECLKRSPSCDTHKLFKTASSTVEKMCGERAPLFEKVRPCLEKYGDIPAQVCDAKCHGRANLTAFVNHPAIVRAAKMGGNIVAVTDHLGGLCSSLHCELPCVTLELNKVCPLSGWLMLDILLQPLDAVANLLLDASPTLKDYLEKKMDKRCHFTLQKRVMKITWKELLFLFSSLTTTHCEVIQQPVDVHSSPLDSSGKSNLEQPSFWFHGTEFANEPPPCHTACTAPVVEVLTVFFRSENFNESMHRACNSYHEALACMKLHNHCGTDSVFESLTSGLKYMCREQVEAFTALADCIDENSARVKRDCDHHCHSNSLVTGLALKDTVMTQLDHPIVSKNVNMRRIIEPHMSRFFLSEGCRIGECLMKCMRTKYNMLCEGTAGSILLEMLTRPLSAGRGSTPSFPSTAHLTSFLGGFLPRSCGYLTTPRKGHNDFRIDPELDKEIKRMYSDKNRPVGVPLQSSLSEPVMIENPFLEVSNLFHRVSPIDTMAAPELGVLGNGDVWEEESKKELKQLKESSASGVEESSGSGIEESSGSGVEESSGSGVEESSGSGVEESSGSGVEESSGNDEENASGSGEEDLSGSGNDLVQSHTLTNRASQPMVNAKHETELLFMVDESKKLPSYPVKAGTKYKVHTIADAKVEALQANSSVTSSHKNEQ
ncbi:hypothetical protein RB195_013644 [Necator americanus]|uniref:Chondroitin proteoglycan 4 domain-containing protein n=1 Tax=Necator americanus TaxID=51031 RepID=A0ABR1DWH1_NECAM